MLTSSIRRSPTLNRSLEFKEWYWGWQWVGLIGTLSWTPFMANLLIVWHQVGWFNGLLWPDVRSVWFCLLEQRWMWMWAKWQGRSSWYGSYAFFQRPNRHLMSLLFRNTTPYRRGTEPLDMNSPFLTSSVLEWVGGIVSPTRPLWETNALWVGLLCGMTWR